MQKIDKNNMTGKKKAIVITSSILGVLVILAGTFFIYTGIYYHAEDVRIEKYIEAKKMHMKESGYKKIEFVPETPNDTGIIMYPGAKVEYTAYKPLMASLADKGYTSFITGMPFNMAFFKKDAAEGIVEKHPNVKHWYMMGHSLGGVVASTYTSSHLDKYEGVIMLGSYPDKDLSETNLYYLSIYGSEDKVLNIDKYNDAKSKWPSKSSEYVVLGGCHAGVGMYGPQKGDGDPSITSEEQIDITVSVIIDFLKSY